MNQININSATETELVDIIHIGPSRAKAIINNRPYKDLYELSSVFGLGRTRVDAIIAEGLATV